MLFLTWCHHCKDISKHHAPLKAWASIKCNLNNNITCYSVVTYTAKLSNHTIPNKGSWAIDSPASTFEGLRYREIDMVNSYNWHKVETFEAKKYTLKSSNPMHPSKNRVNHHHNFSQTFIFTGNHWFLSLGGSVLTQSCRKSTSCVKVT